MSDDSTTTERRRRAPSRSRLKVLEALPVHDSKGFATSTLKDRSGYEGTLTGLTNLLNSMERDGLVRRVIKGKRCYEIALLANASEPSDNGTDAVDLGVDDSGGRIADPFPGSTASELDYSMLAAKLLEAAIDAANAPARLAKEHSDMSGRLASVLADNQRLRSKLQLAQDELSAKTVECDGLRRRMGDVQRNLDAVLVQPNIRMDPERERFLRDLSRLMREKPNQRA